MQNFGLMLDDVAYDNFLIFCNTQVKFFCCYLRNKSDLYGINLEKCRYSNHAAWINRYAFVAINITPSNGSKMVFCS